MHLSVTWGMPVSQRPLLINCLTILDAGSKVIWLYHDNMAVNECGGKVGNSFISSHVSAAVILLTRNGSPQLRYSAAKPATPVFTKEFASDALHSVVRPQEHSPFDKTINQPVADQLLLKSVIW